jgi:hypothetical protein
MVSDEQATGRALTPRSQQPAPNLIDLKKSGENHVSNKLSGRGIRLS